MDRLPDDTRSESFLRKDWIYRVQNSGVKYILQGQVHPNSDTQDGNPEFLNPAVAWDESLYQWHDIYEINIEEPILDNAKLSRLDMNPNRSPTCIKIPLATTPHQYASLGHARAIIYPKIRSVRASSESEENQKN